MRKFRITVRPIVAGAIILAAAGCFNALRQKPGIPESPPVTVEDRAVGEQLRDELLSRYPEDTQPEDRQQVLGVTSRLLDAAGDPNGWNITIFQDGAEVNAAASRGKQIFIWTGLLDAVNNDEELSTVLGHEIGHVLADHEDVHTLCALVGLVLDATHVVEDHERGERPDGDRCDKDHCSPRAHCGPRS